MRISMLSLSAIILAGATAHTAALACSACGCTLNSDWGSQGLTAGRGWRFDFRFDYFDQNELRTGSEGLSRSDFRFPNDREIQQSTINRNYSFNLDYSPNKDWGIDVQLPYFDRDHGTIAPGDTEISTSHASGISDIRLIGHYQGFSPERNTGIEFGIKLPTGRFTQEFATGPQAGHPLDRGVQLGTGTTDILLGIYNFGALSPDWGYFAQALVQAPFNSREKFKPGAGINLNVGLRYTANSTFVPQLQINVRTEKREQGANADIENSGATLAYLSPGLTWNFTRRLSAFGFVQVPIYQRVNGLQIEARLLGSIGVHYIF